LAVVGIFPFVKIPATPSQYQPMWMPSLPIATTPPAAVALPAGLANLRSVPREDTIPRIVYATAATAAVVVAVAVVVVADPHHVHSIGAHDQEL